MSSSTVRSWSLTVLGVVLLVVTVGILGSHYWGSDRVGRVLTSATLPPDLRPLPVVTRAEPKATKVAPGPAPAVRLGVPVGLDVPSHAVAAVVSAHPLMAGGALYVPADPREVGWWSTGAAPGSGRGTIVLVAHIDYGGVQGAFADLSTYRPGQVIWLRLADGRRLRYVVAAAPIGVLKSAVDGRAAELFDQVHSYGTAQKGRLLLLSCGGAFDNRTGHYESNIFVYALPA